MADFQTLQADFFAGGFDHLNDAGAGLARAKRYLNAAYKRDIVKHANWPFRETTSTGSAPLTVGATLGPVASVFDTTRNVKLHPVDRRTLNASYSDLSIAGSAQWYYLQAGVIKTYPVGGTLTVVHWQVPVDLSANGDTPIVPADYHELIVIGALRRAHMDAQNFDAAQAYKTELLEGLQTMESELLQDQYDESELVLDGDVE